MHPVLCRWPWGGTLGAYSATLAASYVLAVGWVWTQRRRAGLSDSLAVFCYGVIVTAAVLGAKLAFLVVEWDAYKADPWDALRTFNSGWVMWGGWLGGVAASLSLKAGLRERFPFWRVSDYTTTSIALAQPLGRMGCLMDGCCHGAPTTLPWGIVFRDPGSSLDPALLGVALHPTQLLEALGTALAAAALIGWVLPATREGRLRMGTATAAYALYYAVMRFGIELLRGDDRGVLLSPALSPSQWISLASAIFCAAVLYGRGVRPRPR